MTRRSALGTRHSAALGLVLVLGALGSGVWRQDAGVGGRLYVTNQDDATISVVDLASRRVVEAIDLRAMGFGPNAKPHHAQVEPDGRFWYVTLIGAGKVLKLDRENRIVGSVDLEVPGLLGLHPTKDLLVVARSMSAVNPPQRIALIRRSDMTLLEEYEVFFPRPHGIVVDPRGEHVYVASLGVNQLARVRLEDGELELVDVEGPYHTFVQLAISPDGQWLVATGQTSGDVLLFDISEPGLPRLRHAIPIGGGPFESAFSYDGRHLVVTNIDADRVTIIDAATRAIEVTLEGEGFSQPHGVGLSPDGRFVFVSNRFQSGGAHDHEGKKATGAGTLVAICLATRSVESVIPVGHYAAGIGVPVPAARPATPATCR
jgi:YVTN family beta-propeller protein